MTRSDAGLPRSALAALDKARADYGDADVLLIVLARAAARDVDAAETPSQRATAIRVLLDLCDRLDLVPLAPGRGQAAAPPAPVAPTSGGDGDADNPFGVPDVPPELGHTA